MSSLPNGYELSDDRARIDAEAAHAFLARSYWSPWIALRTVRKAIENSWCPAILHDGRQFPEAGR